MQMLTTEAAQAEIINEDFTSPETVLPLPSFDQSLQRLPQQAFWRWTIQNLSWTNTTQRWTSIWSQWLRCPDERLRDRTSGNVGSFHTPYL